MTVNISQQQQHPREDIHIKRKASESLENEQRLSKRFHRLNIQPNNATNGRSAFTQVYQYPTQNGYSIQPYPSPSAAVNSATATSPTQYNLPQTHSTHNYEIQRDSSTISPISSSPNSTCDPEAMQVEDLPRKLVSSSPSLTDDNDGVESGSVSNATNTTDDDDDDEDIRSRNKTKNRKDRVILIPTIDKHIDKIPEHLLRQDKRTALSSSSNASSDTKNNSELVLYSDPSSLSVPREHDSVRKVILEARARARVAGTGQALAPGSRVGERNGAIATPGIPAYTPRSVPEPMTVDSADATGRATAAVGGGRGGGFDGTSIMAVDNGPSLTPPSLSNSSIGPPAAAPTGIPAPVPKITSSSLPPSNGNTFSVGLNGPSVDSDAMDID